MTSKMLIFHGFSSLETLANTVRHFPGFSWSPKKYRSTPFPVISNWKVELEVSSQPLARGAPPDAWPPLDNLLHFLSWELIPSYMGPSGFIMEAQWFYISLRCKWLV